MSALPRTRISFFWHTSLNNLRRGGQRVIVAVLCVAFGVMSLVAMTMLSSTLERTLVNQPEEQIGADLTMNPDHADYLLPEDLSRLEALVAEGVLEEYTLVAYTSSLAFHKPDTGTLIFPGKGLGVDPDSYPLAGNLTLDDPDSSTLATLLQAPGDVIITRDLAAENDLQVGDTIFLSDLEFGKPLEAHVRGIAVDTPDHTGSKLYYSHATAEQLVSGGYSLNTALANSADPEAALDVLRSGGLNAFSAAKLAEADADTQEMFSILLNGAGILGLLVGGIGIANTMQVLLRRRRKEVAIWKMLGYGSRDLSTLFSIEAGLLGIAGSLLGAGLGVLVSLGLVELFNRTSNLLVSWELSIAPIVSAFLVGVATTVIFAQWSIAGSSRAVPQSLLREEPRGANRMPWYQGLLLLAALAIPFTAVVSLVMGSLLKGVGVLLVALGGLVGLGGLLGGALWLLTHILPLRGAPLLAMARNNLKRRGLTPIFALIALFVGVATLTFSIVITQNASEVMESAEVFIEGDNLLALSPADQTLQVQQAIAGLAPQQVSYEYETRVRTIQVAGDPDQRLGSLLVSQKEPGDYRLEGAEWGSERGGYAPRSNNIPVGTLLDITLRDGSVHSLPVVGSYLVDFDGLMRPEFGLLIPQQWSEEIAPPDQIKASLRVSPGHVNEAAAGLGKSLPQATVINLVAYAARFTETYRSLFLFAVSMAGLALLAGVLLIANSVSLSMLDRRYEIGVLKAMGYARKHILFTLVIEYAFIGLVATAAGLAVVKGFVWVMSLQNELAASMLKLSPLAAGAVTLLAMGLTLFAVLAATWKPTLVSPLVILNDRE